MLTLEQCKKHIDLMSIGDRICIKKINCRNFKGYKINITSTTIEDKDLEDTKPSPTTHEKTWIWFDGQDNYEEFDWSGEISRPTMIDDGFVQRNPVKIEIGTNVTSIGYNVFSDCRNLTSITIPNSVTSIGDYAFYYCTSLTSITIPNSVASIGYSAFNGCLGLTTASILGFTQQQIIENDSNWGLNNGMTITASDGTFILNPS